MCLDAAALLAIGRLTRRFSRFVQLGTARG
jgi:hypothetical protein